MEWGKIMKEFAITLLVLTYNLILIAGTTYLVVTYNWSAGTFLFTLCLMYIVKYNNKEKI